VLRACALTAFLLGASALWAADPSLPDYVPPGTKVLIGVEVRSILDSDLGKSVIDQVKTAAGDQWMKEMPLKGFDPFKDIDELWIASAATDKNAPSLAILRGRFNSSRLPTAVGSYHQVPLVPIDAKREQLVAILDPATLLVGDRITVERAIDRRAARIPADTNLATTATAMRERYWIWAVANHLDGLVALKTAPQGMQGVDSFEFGLSLNRDLEIVAQLHMRTAEDARKLLGTLTMLQMMAQNQEQGSQVHMESHANGKTLDISVRVPEGELKQAWEQQRAAIADRLSHLPQEIAAARAGKSFNPFGDRPAGAAPAAQPASPASPPSRESKIVSDQDGNTVQLTLPGGR